MYKKNIYNKPIFKNVKNSSEAWQIYYYKKKKTYILCCLSEKDCEYCYFKNYKKCKSDGYICSKKNIIYEEKKEDYEIAFSVK